MRRIYAERRKYLLDRLATDFGGYGSFKGHQAGMQIAFHLDHPYVDTEIARRANEHGLTAQPYHSSAQPETPTTVYYWDIAALPKMK